VVSCWRRLSYEEKSGPRQKPHSRRGWIAGRAAGQSPGSRGSKALSWLSILYPKQIFLSIFFGHRHVAFDASAGRAPLSRADHSFDPKRTCGRLGARATLAAPCAGRKPQPGGEDEPAGPARSPSADVRPGIRNSLSASSSFTFRVRRSRCRCRRNRTLVISRGSRRKHDRRGRRRRHRRPTKLPQQ
jgi:hypothetical protein